MTAPAIGTPIGRWSGFGPYYAMFPVDFTFDVVRKYCPKGGSVFDPFAGRGTSIYAAAAQERSGLGIELNPVGWVYSQTKLHPAPKGAVLHRLKQLEYLAHVQSETFSSSSLPEFFQHCYSPRVLNFLLTARQELRWRKNRTDMTLMAIILVYLHAKVGSGLSNQMRQSKAMSPAYSIRWWQERNMRPPDINPVEWLKGRIEWRYAKGLPKLRRSDAWLGDSTQRAYRAMHNITYGDGQRFNLLFTSPPYFAVTNYQYDQWIRLWMLGGLPQPVAAEERKPGRYESKTDYYNLLQNVFSRSAPLLQRDATVYVRTDAREYTRNTTELILTKVFPRKRLEIVEQPYSKNTQTSLFGDTSKKPGEVDFILFPKTTS